MNSIVFIEKHLNLRLIKMSNCLPCFTLDNLVNYRLTGKSEVFCVTFSTYVNQKFSVWCCSTWTNSYTYSFFNETKLLLYPLGVDEIISLFINATDWHFCCSVFYAPSPAWRFPTCIATTHLFTVTTKHKRRRTPRLIPIIQVRTHPHFSPKHLRSCSTVSLKKFVKHDMFMFDDFFHFVVNFINILRKNFTYKRCFCISSYMYIEKAAETTFIRKICM